MKIAFIGTGYVGLVSGTCFAELGAEVTCIDKDRKKIQDLNNGKIPIFEPGLEELVKKHQKSGRLRFTDNLKDGVNGAEIVFIAVGTPTDANNGNADLSFVYGAAEELAEFLQDETIIVTKSTVPVGTGKRVKEIVSKARKALKFDVASNPEFLREGCAVNDFLYPDRIVLGIQSNYARKKLEKLYKPLVNRGVSILFTDIQTAELTKYAANAFLATKIAFINEIADMCEKMDANVSDIAHGMGLDHRIGENYLSPGPGYGGSCFPKDTLALQYMANEYKTGEKIISSVISSNDSRKENIAERIVDICNGDIKGKTLAILGLAFKANTNDMRESPSLPIIKHLLDNGAKLQAYDPEAMTDAKEMFSGDINYANDPYTTMDKADAVVIITEWAEFSNLDFDKAKSLLNSPVIIDLRNLYNPGRMAERGLEYHSIGRRSISTNESQLELVSSN